MKELLLYIAQNLVDNADAITVTETAKGDDCWLYEIRADKNDMGKIIGRHGRIIKEIRALAHSVAKRQGTHISVEIVD